MIYGNNFQYIMYMYKYKYNKYKHKYNNLKNNITLINDKIQFLTHYTTEENFIKIIKSGVLKPINYDVVMFSIFPIGKEKSFNPKIPLPYTNNKLKNLLRDNLSITNYACIGTGDTSILLLFTSKLLLEYPLYYLSRNETNGKINGYYTNEIKKSFPNLPPSSTLENELNNLSYYPEVGFYHKIAIKNNLKAIILPEQLENKKINSIINNLGVTVFRCNDIMQCK